MVDKNCWGFRKTQSVLPLVFDDSMSYYEALSRLVYTVNQLIELCSGSVDTTLKEYIDNRFDNLMINAAYDHATETIYFKKGTLPENEV